MGSTTTLASTQIEYATFTVTAGFKALSSASLVAASASRSSGGGSSGAASAVSLGWSGWILGVVGLGVGVGVVVL